MPKGVFPASCLNTSPPGAHPLCLGPDSDVAGMLTETGAGMTADYEDEAGIRAALEELYQKFQAGKLAQPVDSSIGRILSSSLREEWRGFWKRW